MVNQKEYYHYISSNIKILNNCHYSLAPMISKIQYLLQNFDAESIMIFITSYNLQHVLVVYWYHYLYRWKK